MKEIASQPDHSWDRHIYDTGGRFASVCAPAGETVGVNMHTVNKAYNVLKQEGFISLDKRRGAVIALDADKLKALEEMLNLIITLQKDQFARKYFFLRIFCRYTKQAEGGSIRKKLTSG